MESSHLSNEDIKNFMEVASKDKNIKIVSCQINRNLQDIGNKEVVGKMNLISKMNIIDQM